MYTVRYSCPILTKIITWRYIRILIKSKYEILRKFLGRFFKFLQINRQMWHTYKRLFGTLPRERSIK
jgi:hypothetical protein